MLKPINLIKYVLIFTIIEFIAGCIAGKINNNEPLSYKKNIKIADQLYEAGSYYNAVDYYHGAYESKPDDNHVISQLAEIYFLSRDYKNAEIWYKKLHEANNIQYPLSTYKYAQVLKMNGKYEEAKKMFSSFILNYKGSDYDAYNNIVNTEIQSCFFGLYADKNPVSVNIIHLDKPVNAAYTEFAPIPLGDSLLLFSSLLSDSVIKMNNKMKGKIASRIYKVRRNVSQFDNISTLPSVINDDEFHNGNGTFSSDGKRFYFTRCNQNEQKKVICSIYLSEYKDDNWKLPVKLSENINSADQTCTHPAVGSTIKGGEILYFASDRKNGFGGMDIWYSTINKKGEGTDPVNIGESVNTTRDEITPFYDTKNQTLYFSSNGHIGLGGFDIFKTEGTLKKWSMPENIGYPLNSRVDDMYYVTEKSGAGGYFVSNRPGSIALKSETCCDDIFRFEWKKIINVAVQGFVYDEADSSKIPLDSASVSLFLQSRETADLSNIESDLSFQNEMYFFNLSLNKEYKISASKQGYFSGKELFREFTGVNTFNKVYSDTMRVDLYLKKMIMNVGYRLQNIYYDFDKATLRPESKNTLDSLMILLEEHPTIKIELGSHTDYMGTNEYNIDLSQRRAQSVVNYLIEHEVPQERLAAKGYGEEVPIAPNENPDGTDNSEGRQFNRRTEFKIIGELQNVEYVKPGEEKYE